MNNKIIVAVGKAIESLNIMNKMHWSKRHGLSKEWEKYIWATLNGKIHQATAKMRVKVTSIRKHALDSDNLVGGFKGGRDALKRLGLIVDDSPQWAEFLYEQKIQKVGTGTIIEIEEIHPTDGELISRFNYEEIASGGRR